MMDIFKRNKKTTVGLIISVVSVVLVATIILTTMKNGEENEKKHNRITFDEFIEGKFQEAERGFSGSWYSDHQILWKDNNSGDLVLYNTDDQSNETLISKADLQEIHDYAFFISSYKDQYLLIGFESTPVYRHSSLTQYVIYEKSSKKTYPIFINKEGEKLQYVTWMAEKTSLVIVYENNIYIREDPTKNANKQITNDGQPGIIYNGIPDWVYEEEVLGTNNALYFSKDGSKIAYPRFDDSKVQQFFYSVYGTPSDPFNHQYPSNVMIRYPKAGTNNPTVELKVWDNQKQLTIPVKPPPEVSSYTEYLFTAATWITNDRISIIWMNRIQNQSVISECEENNNIYECQKIEKELKEPKGWVDLFQPPRYNLKGDAFIQIRPPPVSKANDLRFNQIYYFEKRQRKGAFLTSGQFAVVSILDWNEDLIYFIGTRPNYPGKRHLYSVTLNKEVKCITCSSDCEYIRAHFPHRTENNNPTKYVEICSSPIKVPVVTLRNIENHEVMATIEDNSNLDQLLSNKSLPKRRDLMEPISDDKRFHAPVSLLLPLDFDENKKYPTLVYVYGGPGSQEINYAWNSPAWPEYLVTSRNIIYMIIDGRGTGFQSVDYQFANYNALGTLEIKDQIQVTQSIQKKFPFIDKDRTGIWGWSYGGYVSLMTLIQDKKNVFSCGISVAPPTDWLFYDSVYTERYMGLPHVNQKGYKRASVLNKVEGLRNKTLFLNHGSADDNVHYQQSMMLIKEMELRNIDFQEATYPDENHGLGGVSKFLYHHMDKFLGKCFGYHNV